MKKILIAMDYNKLWSLINKNNLSKSAAGRIVNMSPQGFISMMNKQSMAVDTLEKFAMYFKVSASYFFEDGVSKKYQNNERLMAVEEPNVRCALCAEKDKRIADKEEIIRGLNKHIELLEFNLGKFRKNGSV